MCRINAGGSPREVEGNCLKYLKGGGIEKRVVKTKIKSRGQAGLRGGLNKWGWNPPTNCDTILNHAIYFSVK